jgi:single-strand DNA-binding protein
MSNRSLNKVILIGNLTRDPELRYTPQGTPVCTFGLATNRTWMDANSQKQEATEFHRIVAWHKLGELCSQLLFKGRKTYVEGRLQTRSWTGQDGQERTTTEVVIDNMIVLDSRRKDEGGPEPYKASGATDARTMVNNAVPTVPAATTSPIVSAPSTIVKKTAKVKKDSLPEDTKTKPAKEPEVNEEVKADDIPF